MFLFMWPVSKQLVVSSYFQPSFIEERNTTLEIKQSVFQWARSTFGWKQKMAIWPWKFDTRKEPSVMQWKQLMFISKNKRLNQLSKWEHSDWLFINIPMLLYIKLTLWNLATNLKNSKFQFWSYYWVICTAVMISDLDFLVKNVGCSLWFRNWFRIIYT